MSCPPSSPPWICAVAHQCRGDKYRPAIRQAGDGVAGACTMTEGTTTLCNDANSARRLGRRAMLAGTTGLAVTGLAAQVGASPRVAAQENSSTFVLVPGQ